jgi:hypothetical protein
MGAQYGNALPASGNISLTQAAAHMGVALPASIVSLSTGNINPYQPEGITPPNGAPPHALSEFYGYVHYALVVGAIPASTGAAESTVFIPAACHPGSISVTPAPECTVAAADGGFNLTIPANAGLERSISITISGGGFSETHNITQAQGHTHGLTLSQYEATIDGSGNLDIDITLTSCSDWSVDETISWCAVTPSFGTAGTHTVNIEVWGHGSASGVLSFYNNDGEVADFTIYRTIP